MDQESEGTSLVIFVVGGVVLLLLLLGGAAFLFLSPGGMDMKEVGPKETHRGPEEVIEVGNAVAERDGENPPAPPQPKKGPPDPKAEKGPGIPPSPKK
jgi:hypothetical protein